MKTPHIFIVLALVGTGVAQTTPPNGIRTKTPDLRAFTNATIVVSPNQTIQNATLIIKDGKVQNVGAGIAIPAGAAVIDAKGKTIYPGFVDPYTDYGLPVDPQPVGPRWGGDRGPQLEGKRIGCNAWNDAIHAERAWVSQFQPDQKIAETYLKQGITAVQSAKMDGIFRGRSFVTLLGEGLPNDLVIKPYSLQFASFDKGTSTQDYPSSLMGSIALVRQMFLDVDWYRKAMAAYSADPSQKKPEFNTALDALAASGPQKVVFETDDELVLLRAARISKEFSIPFQLVGSGSEYRRLDEIKATGLPLIVPVRYPKAPEVKTIEDELDVDLATLRHWERARTNPAQLERNGITFAFTSRGLKDRGEYLKDVREAVSYGLSKRAALAALTTVPAQLCELSASVGSLEKGRFANFILCDGDIFDAKTNIFSVWVAGKAYEFKAPDQVDFRGEFAATLGDKALALSLKGDLYQPTGEFKAGDKRASLTGLQVSRDKIVFSSVMDSLGVAGTTRFSARLSDSTLSGQCEFADGSRIDWTAARTAPFTATKDTTAKPEKAPDTVLVSKLTWPDVGFGYAVRPKQENVLVKHATIWTCDSAGVLADADMLVVDGKIARVGKNLTAPGGTRVIDATGKHLTPGIVDEHSHVAISRGVNEGTEAVSAEVRIGDVIDPDDVNIYRALAGGVTILHSLHGSANPIGGQCQALKLKWGSSSEEMKFAAAAPTIKFALGENVKQSNWGDRHVIRYPQTRMGVETIMKDAFQAAREYGADWDKYNALSAKDRARVIPPRRDIQDQALLEVLRSQRYVHCHSYVAPEILMLIRLADQYGFTIGTFTHILEGYKVADEMAAHGCAANSFADWWAYKFEVYDAIPQNPCLLHDRGVLTGINSDSPEMGRRLNQEAAKSVMYCGMSKEEALKMVTINPAIQLKVGNLTGSIKVGKQADFVIWDDDPLSVYAKPVETWIEGTPYFTLTTDSMVRADNEAERAKLIQKVISSGDRGGEAGGFRRGDPEWHCEDAFDVWERLHANQ
ncbi:MAG: amidohydrolase family protein [candidate division Zixibacteria bacterium]|nr:amidohydrolase family protein [candidate division Zixibacteria bacterium]